jgi:hypothetical protein
MVVRPALLCLLLLTALLAGCADTNSLGSAPDSIPTGSAPTGKGAGTASSHAGFDRAESAVTVTHTGNQYQAVKTVTLSNDFGGASKADVRLGTDTGAISFADWSQGGYQVAARLSGSGTTEQAARDNLARLKVTHTDSLASGKLSLATQVVTPTGGCNCGGSLTASLPAQPSYSLTGSTDTGAVSVSGLGGSVLSLTCDTGSIDAEGSFSVANLKTDTGAVQADGVFNDLTATADTGGVRGHLRNTASGTYRFSTDTGSVDVTVTQGGGRAFDATADTQTGVVSVDLSGTHAVGTQSRTHAHVQSDGFDSAALKLTITLSTDTGGVSLQGA